MKQLPNPIKVGKYTISQWYGWDNREFCVAYYYDAWQTGLTFSYREWWF